MSTQRELDSEVHLHTSPLVRWLLIGLGTLLVGLGILGVLLPLLPGTPFLLLAAACYARASRRFYAWLLDNRMLGPVIREYRRSRRIPAAARRRAIALVVVAFGVTILFVAQTPLLRALYGGCGLLVLAILMRLKTVEAQASA